MSLLLRALIPSWGLHPHNLITSQRLHLQISSHRGLEFQHMNPFGWRDTYLLKAYFFPIKLSRQLILFIPVENLLTMGIYLTDSEFIPFIYLAVTGPILLVLISRALCLDIWWGKSLAFMQSLGYFLTFVLLPKISVQLAKFYENLCLGFWLECSELKGIDILTVLSLQYGTSFYLFRFFNFF